MATNGTDQLREMHRGEIAATETYQQALASIDDAANPAVGQLRRIHAEHGEAATTLKQHVRAKGDSPDHGSGAWGAFAKSVEGVATVLGHTPALQALKTGEESGLRSYESALADDELPVECRTLISQTLIPQTRQHIAVLDELIAHT